VGRLFGTDGVRGLAGCDLTGRLAMDLSAAAAGVLTSATSRDANGRDTDGRDTDGQATDGQAGRRPVAVVGRDPRSSGEFLSAAVVAGLAGSGIDVLDLGVIPTPAVAYLTAALDADFGVMLSASHNPAPDNGIKFFARGGRKLSDADEDDIEARLADMSRGAAPPPAVPADGFGRVRDASGEAERYLEHLLGTLTAPASGSREPGSTAAPAPRVDGLDSGPARPGLPLSSLRVVVDCANGAAYQLSPRLLRRSGAEVIAVGAEPDGENINEGCGSTHLEILSAAVVKHGADAGIAHDGDADRCLAVDAAGQVIDGDQILAVLALSLKDAGRLDQDTVVATVMSNLGFRRAMRAAGIRVVETPVGDRYLVAAMRAGKYVLGGEQSGHLVMLEHATTGDGLLTGLHLLAVAAARAQPLADLVRVMTRHPQVLINIAGVDKTLVAASAPLRAAVAAAEAELGENGRVLVRASGTEAAVRVMVEAVDEVQAHRLAGQLAAAVRGIS